MQYNKQEIIDLFAHQARTFFNKAIDISDYIDDVIKEVEIAFSHSANKYYGENMRFSTLHSVQYCVFLYFLSKAFTKAGKTEYADVVYYLNKTLNCVDLYHGIQLPKIFGFEHPLGTVVGRATFGGDFLFLYQGCTIGGSNGAYPTINDHLTMFSDSKILGNSHIGSYVILGANTVVIDNDIPDCCLVFGQSPNLIIKQRSMDEMKERFKQFWKE